MRNSVDPAGLFADISLLEGHQQRDAISMQGGATR
jgi:hypothetical protein